MAQSLSNRFLKSSLLRTIETLLSIVVGFFMLPFMVSSLGEHLYGIWIIVSSITGVLYIFDLGFATAVTRFISKSLAVDDRKETSKIVSSAFFIYFILALIIMVVSLAASFFASHWDVDGSNANLIQILVIITGVNIALEFPFKAFSGIAAYHMRYDLLALSRIIFKLLSTAFIVWAVMTGYQLIAIAIIGLLASVLSNITFYSIAKYLEPDVKVKVRYINKSIIKSLSGYSAWAFFIDTSRLLKERGDLWIIGYLLSAAQLTVYYVALRLVEYATQILFSAVNMTTPLLTADFSKGDFKAFEQKLYLFTRLNSVLGLITIFGFILFANELFTFWMGDKFDADTAFLICCVVLAGKMVAFFAAPIGNGLMAINKPRTLSMVVAFEAVVSLVTAYFLILSYGLTGAAFGVVLPFLFTRTFLIFYLLQKDIKFSILSIYQKLVKSFVVLSLPFMAVFYIKYQLSSSLSLLYFFALILLYGLLTYLVLPLLFTLDEKRDLKKILPHKIYLLLFGVGERLRASITG
ncbi:oligosaccharide flippase family protein [Alkalimarinus sediminis]|uniref:Oligosaccharide flippase family protein n=1 Tax=Alkalimarinus sediminis TaxID=1632866 RepID=A0A9E8KRK0_9ALTE|nr:oligosaccharide flippase family protein [Alkalimarinus sediminis]UZW76162.1 oligosaccharide flippase family protein [Alkalimarinus sediminis]